MEFMNIAFFGMIVYTDIIQSDLNFVPTRRQKLVYKIE